MANREDFRAKVSIPKAIFEFAYAFCDHAEAAWQLLNFARNGDQLPADMRPAQNSQATQHLHQSLFNFETLLIAMRGSQHGPGNDDVEALLSIRPGCVL